MTASNQDALYRLSVILPPEIHEDISASAVESWLSINRAILQLLRVGLNSEREKKQRLDEMLRRYRESTDPVEINRLGDELGSMIFGR